MDIATELNLFECYVNDRRFEEAYPKLLFLLTQVSVHQESDDKVFDQLTKKESQHVATRIASATFQLIMDRDFILTEEDYQWIALFGRGFSILVAITPYQNADHVIRYLLSQAKGGNMDMSDFRKMLFVWSIYSDVVLPFDNFIAAHPKWVTYALLNALDMSCYVSHDVHERRELIINRLAKESGQLVFDDLSISLAGAAWMKMAYASTPNKNKAKQHINQAYRVWMLEKGIQEPQCLIDKKNVRVKVSGAPNKPTVVVICEKLNRHHAMFRCYSDVLYGLKERFHVIGMGADGYVKEDVHDAFHQFVYFSNELPDIKKSVGRIIKQKPDIIIYLSLGMNNVTIPLSNLRLAPMQLMFLGHPSPSMSDAIDYVVTIDGLSSDQEIIKEQLLNMPLEWVVMLDTIKFNRTEQKPLLEIEMDNAPIKVAIPSYAIKISYPFIEALLRIKDGCSKCLEFHFFPGISSLPFRLFEETLCELLPNAIVHKPQRYDQYLALIDQTDLYLGPFPFGNTNGNIDAMKVGLPMLVLEGDTSAGRTDAVVLRMAGAPESAIVDNVDDYIETATHLIDDDEYRLDQQSLFRAIDLGATCFKSREGTDFADGIHSVYQRHDELKSSHQKVIKLDDVLGSLSDANKRMRQSVGVE